MQKKICKIITGIFIILFIISGCTATEIIEEETPRQDFNGYKYTVVQSTSTAGVIGAINDGNPLGYVNSTLLADILLKRIEDMKTAYNCDIVIETISDDLNTMMGTFAAGETYGDIFFTSDNNLLINLALGGVLQPLETVSTIDCRDEEKWGGYNVLENNMAAGSVYGLTPMCWPMKQPHVISLLVINKKLLLSLGFDDPCEYFEKGQWNWDNFEKLIPLYTYDDGENKYKALCTRPHDMVKLAMLSNGVEFVVKNSDGNYVSDLSSPNAVEAMDWVIGLGKNNPDSFANSFGSWPTWQDSVKPFLEKTALMTLTPTWMIYDTIALQIENFGLLPFPAGPKGESGKYPGVFEGSDCFSIFFNGDNIEGSGFILSELCKPFDEFKTKQDLIDYYSRNILFDNADAEIIFKITENAKYSYWPVKGDAFWGVVSQGIRNKTANEIISANEHLFQTTIDEYISKNMEFIDYLSDGK